ncbi:hypothetical protein Hanom_Chr12g01162141 [Helianthus anomalus]
MFNVCYLNNSVYIRSTDMGRKVCNYILMAPLKSLDGRRWKLPEVPRVIILLLMNCEKRIKENVT